MISPIGPQNYLPAVDEELDLKGWTFGSRVENFDLGNSDGKFNSKSLVKILQFENKVLKKLKT